MSTSTATETPDLSLGSPAIDVTATKPETPATPDAKATGVPAAKPVVKLGTMAVRIRNGERRTEQEAQALAREKAETETAVRVRTAQLTAHQPTIERAKQIVHLAKTDAIGLLKARGLSDEQIQAEILKLAAPPDPRAVAESRLTRAERALAEERKERESEKYDAATQKALSVFVRDTHTTAAQHPALTRALADPNGESEVRRRSLEIAMEYSNKRGVELTDPQIRKILEKEAADYFRTEDAKKPKPAPKARAMAHDVLTMTDDQLKSLTLAEAQRMGADERAGDAADEVADDPLIGANGKFITEEEETARLRAAIAKATNTEAPKFRKSRVDGTWRRNAK